MADRLGVVTCPKIVMEGPGITYVFLIDSKIPDEMHDLSSTYGVMMRNDENGRMVWSISAGRYAVQVYSWGFNDDEEVDDCLRIVANTLPDCILLMQRDDFERFNQACEHEGVTVLAHHFDRELYASRKRQTYKD